MSTGILFHGVDLEDIAPVKIEDIRVSPIDVSPVARQRIGFGQDFVRMSGGNRTIAITFALLENNQANRYKLIQDIIDWTGGFEEYPLYLPMYDDRHFDCRCTGYPEPSFRQWWEGKLRLVFTTYENPYWTANDEIRAECGTKIAVGGTAPPLMRIERKLSSRANNQTYSADGRSMKFERIPAGNMKIDLNKQTAEVSGASIMQYFDKTSWFILPKVGNMTISGTGTVIYRERWL